ncbi:hypothetical protein TNCV_438371 [Trichonephila clavipes]|nr:hypothetical protein TNCV_438371 [Trichonephila clavipes]
MSSFKKYKCLTIFGKQKVIEEVEKVERKVDVAKTFVILLSSLSTILKNKGKVVSITSSVVRKRVSKVDTDITVWGALSDAETVALDQNNTESDKE